MPTLRTWINHSLEYEPHPNLRRAGVPISGCTVAEILAEASRILNITFEPYEGPMWFRVHGNVEYPGAITDIRIRRGETDIYPLRPVRNTSFLIEDSDIISIYIFTD